MSRDTTIRYRINPNISRFTVRAFAGGLLSSFAHNPTFAIRGFTGEIRFVPDRLEAASLRLQINATGLELSDDVNDKDRKEIERTMREEVLEVGRYPEIVFESTAVNGEQINEGQYRIKITGNLSLHGITNRCVFDARMWVSGNSLRAQGEFTLRQTDYRINLVKAAGGTIKVKDELKLSFDIAAHQEGE